MVFNNDDLNDLINISNNAINNWLGEIYLLTIRIQEFINSDSFTGNASKAIKTYLQEVHLQTLIPEITMLLNDYQSKLALYSKEYAEIDEDYHKVINTDVLDDLISFYITDDLNVCYDYFSGILSEISDIIELTNPSNDKANNSCARFRYRISKLEYSINGIENKTSFEGTQPLCTYCDSLDKLLTNAISRSESSVTSYMPGQFQMSELYKNASSSYIKSINYYNDHEKEIKIATQYCKDVSEKIYEEKLQKYQDELEKKQKSAKKTIRLNGAVKGLSGILQLASGYGLFAAAPATAGTSIIPGGSFIVFGTSDLIEGLGEVFAGEDQKNPLCEAAFFGDEKAYHVVNFIYTIVSPIILNKITGPCTIGGKVSDIAGHVEGGSKTINPNEIRYSQSSVNGSSEIIDSMKKNGWKGDPIDVVEMPDGIYTTIDNTRVVSARKAGINVQANVHGYNDILPEEYIERFTTKKGVPATWGDAISLRVGKQKTAFRNSNPFGAFDMDTIK